MVQFPQIERIHEPIAAVRTWVGTTQIGNVAAAGITDKKEWLNSAEAELRREGEKQGWNLNGI